MTFIFHRLHRSLKDNPQAMTVDPVFHVAAQGYFNLAIPAA
jgi:hypothetical protein